MGEEKLSRARFYCENCGKEVPFNAAICPYCRHLFDAVKCPICGFSSRSDEFMKGCPKCGYLATPADLQQQRASQVQGVKKRPIQRKKKKQDLLVPFLAIFLVLLTIGVVIAYFSPRGL